jgi:hypothetical protein
VTHEAGPDLAGSRRFDLGGVRVDPLGVVAWLIPAALVLYLALKNGGYDVIPRSDAGVVVWLVILVGTLAGALPIVRLRSAAGVAIVLLAAFGVWTALALAWSSSDERTMIEVARVATYLGFLVLASGLQRRGYGRELLHGTTAGIGVVVTLAALSRMEPNWFPTQDIAQFLPGIDIQRRLAYPLNYSTGLAAFAAMGLPLFLSLMASGRTVVGRSLGAAAMPIAALALWWTGSGLAIPLGVIGLFVYLVLSKDRLATLASLGVAAVAGLIVILASHSQSALERGVTTPEAQSQGDHMLLIAIVVCVAAIAARAALELWLRGVDREAPLVSPQRSRQLLVAGAVALAAIVVLAAASGQLSKRWDSFRSASGLDPNQGGQTAQVTDVSARGRYQYWSAAVKAWESKPVYGIGPGTYEFWWNRHGDPAASIFVVNAHSLYLEVLAELGLVGFLLITSFVVVVLAIGALRAWRSTLGARPELAAAAAACFVFAAGAAVDWLWQLAVLPAAFMLLIAVAVGGEEAADDRPATRADDRQTGWRRFGPPAAMVTLCLVALVAILIPLGSASAVDQSRQDVADGNLASALDSARNAVAIEPFAATPRLQEATTLELMGRLPEAVTAAREATDRESTDWRPWVVLSRLEAENGNPGAAVAAYRHAFSLFPRGLPGAS